MIYTNIRPVDSIRTTDFDHYDTSKLALLDPVQKAALKQ